MRRRAVALLLTLALAPVAIAAGAAPEPLPLVPPLPDLAPLVPFAAAPLDKPAMGAPEVALPAPPAELPPLPLAPLVLPEAEKPTAFMPPPRTLPCAGAWLRIASESLECGRARLLRGETEDAARALDQAVRGGTDRDLLREARYWLAEAYYRLGRVEQSDWLFRQVAQDSPAMEYGVWSLHGSGWTALRLLDAARARTVFTQLLAGPLPSPLDVWARHGLGLANYALARHEEAAQAWAPLERRGAAPPFARDLLFWQGEVFGRTGQHDRAVAELNRFVQGGPHPLLGAGLVRLGWWSLAGGRFAEAAATFRNALAGPAGAGNAGPSQAERDWVEAGLGLALLQANDGDGARDAVRALIARRSPLALPVQLRLAMVALETGRPAEAQAIVQEVLGETLSPAARAWALLAKGEAHRLEGNLDEARTQYDLGRRGDPGGPTAAYAGYRLARTNFELREFGQAVGDVAPLVAPSVVPAIRAAALLLQAEAAYHAGDQATAAAAFRRFVTDFPQHPLEPNARLGLAWTALRQGQREEARRQFAEFGRSFPDHPHAPDALVLAAEGAAAAGDLAEARQLLERVVASYPSHPRADFARLNRALLMLHQGEPGAAAPALRGWIARAPFPPLLGRAHAALGVALLPASPAEAAREFERAQREGVGALASLGLGAAALAQDQWDAAAQAFTDARDTGTTTVMAAAEYGLAVVAFHRGAREEWKKGALAVLSATPPSPLAPRLLYVLTGLAVEDKDLPGALALAQRLVDGSPGDETADDALERVGRGAVAAPDWPIAREAYTLLRERAPGSPWVETSRLALAEAQIETGRAAEARQALEQFLAGAPQDPRAPQAWIVLARAREATGDRAGALEAYGRASREGQGAAWAKEAHLGHARLLTQERRWAEARGVLEPLLRHEDRAVVAEAAAGLGDVYQGEGDHLAAAEYYLSAAYVLPDSPVARKAVLGAARSLAAGKQNAAAAAAYRKLLAQSDLPAELAAAARQGLADVTR